MIKAEGLEFQYNDESKFSFPSFDCGPGNELLIIGPSGAGKTTLLHVLSGFLDSSKGSVVVSSTDFSKLKGSQKDLFRANNIGIIFQENYFINAISVMQNIMLAQTLAKRKKDAHRITELASSLEIQHLLTKSPSELSRGELQRASIVRAMINSPKVLLADEPTSSLDDANCHRVVKILKEQAKENDSALLIVTHDSRLRSEFSKSIQL